MPCLPESKGKIPEACRNTTTPEDPRVSMGGNWNGLHRRVTCTQSRYDSIWVIVDRLTKVAHFILVKMIYSRAKLAEFYMSRIICLHGIRNKIVSDRGATSKFGEK
jgi:hypothetical protein